jgi:hypothetical protein
MAATLLDALKHANLQTATAAISTKRSHFTLTITVSCAGSLVLVALYYPSSYESAIRISAVTVPLFHYAKTVNVTEIRLIGALAKKHDPYALAIHIVCKSYR